MATDKTNLQPTVVFKEADLFKLQYVLPNRQPKVLPAQLIEDKWIYIFWAKGEKYGFDAGDDSRGSRAVGYQHIAARGTTGEPKRTKDRPEHVWREGYIDSTGVGKYRKIGRSPRGSSAKSWTVERWRRPMPDIPFGNYDGAPAMKLPITTRRGGGTPVRYYFLLSPVRLGKRALDMALAEGGGDALSVWTQDSHPKRSDKNRKNEAPDAAYFQALGTPVDTVYVADPYKLATNILESFTVFLRQYASVRDAMGHGGRTATWNRDLKELGRTDGTPFDAYFIAKTYEVLSKQVKESKEWSWNTGLAEKVITSVEQWAKRDKNTIEMEARFLGNWIRGPAHALIDEAVVGDTVADIESASDDFKDQAAEDRALGLVHWYNVTTLMMFTDSGSLFLGHVSKIAPHNPVDNILVIYKKQKKVLEIDQLAFRKAATVIPDLVLRFNVLDVHTGNFGADRHKALAQKSKDIATTMNNLKYLPYLIETATSTSGVYNTEVKRQIKIGLLLTGESVGRQSKIAGYILEKTIRIKSSHLSSAILMVHEKFPSIGSKLADVHAGKFVTKTKRLHSSVNLFVGFVNMSIAWGETAATLRDRYASASDKSKAIIGVTLDTAGFATDLIEFSGVEKNHWNKVVGNARASGLRSVLSKGTLISFVGTIASVWTIYSSIKDIQNGYSTGDYSVVGGSILVAMGGSLALAAFFVEIPYAGWAVAALVIIGGWIVASTTDHPLDVFITHSVYGSKSRRNTRTFGDKNNKWAGPPLKNGKWPLKHQRWALENLLSTFSIESQLRYDGWGSGRVQLRKPPNLTHGVLALSMGYIPKGAVLVVVLRSKFSRTAGGDNKTKKWFTVSYGFDRRNIIKEEVNDKIIKDVRVRILAPDASKKEPMKVLVSFDFVGKDTRVTSLGGRIFLGRPGNARVVYDDDDLVQWNYIHGGGVAFFDWAQYTKHASHYAIRRLPADAELR